MVAKPNRSLRYHGRMTDAEDFSDWVDANRPFFHWSKPSAVSAQVGDQGERSLVLAWTASSANAQAVLGEAAGELGIHELRMKTSGVEWPERLRRLPSPGSLVDALLSTFGESGEYGVAWLRRDSRIPKGVALATVNDVLAGNARPPESFTVRRGGRPSKGKGPTVEELLIVADMRRENRQTKEIIEKLMARGLSEATAFRRLRLAESPRGAEMIFIDRHGTVSRGEFEPAPCSDSANAPSQ